MNRPDEARAELEETVRLDPQFARAWYNLGLARNAANEIDPALAALARAEALDPGNAQAPYAAATILARQQRTREAAEAARRALRIAPNYSEAAELLRMLSSAEGPVTLARRVSVERRGRNLEEARFFDGASTMIASKSPNFSQPNVGRVGCILDKKDAVFPKKILAGRSRTRSVMKRTSKSSRNKPNQS